MTFTPVPNPIPARMRGLNRAEICDVNFSEFVKGWAGTPDAKPAPGEADPGGQRAGRAGLPRAVRIAADQSRHLDLMARVLRVQNKVFYTIGSSGHEGNAMVARADAAYRSRRSCITAAAASWPSASASFRAWIRSWTRR